MSKGVYFPALYLGEKTSVRPSVAVRTSVRFTGGVPLCAPFPKERFSGRFEVFRRKNGPKTGPKSSPSVGVLQNSTHRKGSKDSETGRNGCYTALLRSAGHHHQAEPSTRHITSAVITWPHHPPQITQKNRNTFCQLRIVEPPRTSLYPDFPNRFRPTNHSHAEKHPPKHHSSTPRHWCFLI